MERQGGGDLHRGAGGPALAFLLVVVLSALAVAAVVAFEWRATEPPADELQGLGSIPTATALPEPPVAGEASPPMPDGSSPTCTPQPSPTGCGGEDACPLPSPSPTAPPTEPARVATPSPSPRPAPPTPRPESPPVPSPQVTFLGEPSAHFWFFRPIPASGQVRVERYYPYGSRGGEGQLPIHHGVELENPEGTAVLAAGAGRVVAAGSDAGKAYGPWGGFYGQVVILEHEERFLDKPVFTLYGHLSQVAVQPGQRVARGEVLGRVGMTGVAMGPHLHFEVRVGEDSYQATRNPELWLRPLPGCGVLAGRVSDGSGKPLPEASIGLLSRTQNQGLWLAAATYPAQEVVPDELLGENFVIGDLPAGTYVLRFRNAGRAVEEEVEVRAGELVFLEVVLD